MLGFIGTIFNTLLTTPLLNGMMFFYSFTHNLGVSIILMTITLLLILTPLIVPALNNAKKQRELKPEIDKIKKKYKNDKQKQAEAQMALLKEHGLNPASGCLTQVLRLLILIAFYRMIQFIATVDSVEMLNNQLYLDFLRVSEIPSHKFLWFDLSQPDPLYILAILSGAFQFFTSKLTLGFTQVGEDAAKKTPEKSDDLAYNIQQQSLYMLPIVNIIISIGLPAGAVLYFVTATIFSMVQTYYVMGERKLPFVEKLLPIKKEK